MKRLFLFLATNLLVVLTISVILNLLGVRPYLTAQGIDYWSLLVFCLVWGMGGALISLAISRWMAKRAMGVQVIDPQTTDATAQQLLQTIGRLAQGAGIPMPEVGVYDSPDVNAFATGPTRSRALVAVSTGLLQKMSRDEIEGVLGHEISHVANGDMVTMTLIQGVVNAFVMFLARVIAFGLSQALRRDDSEGLSRGMYMITVFVLEMVFMLLGSLVVMWFSRQREFRADAGSAQIAGRGKMIQALERLRADAERVPPQAQPAVASLQISGRSGFARWFSTHPPLEERIARLQTAS